MSRPHPTLARMALFGGRRTAPRRTSPRGDAQQATLAHLDGLRPHPGRRRGVHRAGDPRHPDDRGAHRDHGGVDAPPGARRRATAREIAHDLGIPVYDVQLTGYPQRMRDWNASSTRPLASRSSRARVAPAASSASGLEQRQQRPHADAGAAHGRVAVRRALVERRARRCRGAPTASPPTNSRRNSPATSIPPNRSPMLAMSATGGVQARAQLGRQRHRPELLAGTPRPRRRPRRARRRCP